MNSFLNGIAIGFGLAGFSAILMLWVSILFMYPIFIFTVSAYVFTVWRLAEWLN